MLEMIITIGKKIKQSKVKGCQECQGSGVVCNLKYGGQGGFIEKQ